MKGNERKNSKNQKLSVHRRFFFVVVGFASKKLPQRVILLVNCQRLEDETQSLIFHIVNRNRTAEYKMLKKNSQCINQLIHSPVG